MSSVPRITFFVVLLALSFLLPAAIAGGHHDLNGTWVMVPDRCNFGGDSVIQSGTVTIWDREHNITVSRTFNLAGENGTISYTAGIDGQENASIHDGKEIKYKAKWDGKTLVVTTKEDKVPTVERYSLGSDGMLTMAVERPDHQPMALVFQRQ